VDVSVVVVSWNTRDLLARCLASVFAHPPAAAFDVWLVDNGSSDGTPSMVRQDFPQVRLIESKENLGFSAGNNLAMKQAQGHFLLLLNSDAMVLEGTIDALLAAARTDIKIAAVGPRSVNADGSFQASFNDFPVLTCEILDAFGLLKSVWGSFYPSYPPGRSALSRECDWVGGACLLVRRQAIDDVGQLDEGYFMYAEEMDWCYRVRQAGWKVFYCADATVVHVGGASAHRPSAKQRIRLYRSKTRFLRKYKGAVAAAMYRLAIRVSSLLKCGYWLAGSLVGPDRSAAYAQATSHWAVLRSVLQ